MNQAQRGRRYYDANKDLVLKRTKARSDAGRAFLRELKSVPCTDCQQVYDSVCMEFDHRPGEVKLNNVGNMISYTREAIIAEVAKCDVVCANCHRLRTKARGFRAAGSGRPKASRDVI